MTEMLTVETIRKIRLAESGDQTRVDVSNYKARVERIVFIDVVAFDWNCPQHITRRYTESEFEERPGSSNSDC